MATIMPGLPGAPSGAPAVPIEVPAEWLSPGPLPPPDIVHMPFWVQMFSGHYSVLSLEVTEKLENAYQTQVPTVIKSGGRDITSPLDLQETSPNVWRSSTSNLIRYHCHWFFLDNESGWSPMSPSMSAKLDEALKNGDQSVFDGERDYDVRKLFSKNRESGRVRPLMHIGEDGTGEVGSAVPHWCVMKDSRKKQMTFPLPLDACEKLQVALGGDCSAPVNVTIHSGELAGDLAIQLDPLADQHKATHSKEGRAIVLRFIPTWMYRNDNGNWAPFDFHTMRMLDMCCASMSKTAGDTEREYDVEQGIQLNKTSRRTRGMLRLVSKESQAPRCTSQSLQRVTNLQPVSKRLDHVTDSRLDITAMRKLLSDPSAPRKVASTEIARILLHEFDCIVKGGFIRDAIVLDVDTFKDIDVEMDASVTQFSVNDWLERLVTRLEKDFGVVIGTVDQRKRRKTDSEKVKWAFRDSLDSAAEASIKNGIVTIQLAVPDLEVEFVTPWNHAYAPPRNIDFGANNLRLLPRDPAVYQSVALGIPSVEIILKTLQRETHVAYDVAFEPCTDGSANDGAHKNQKAVGAGPTDKRTQLMGNRLEAFREKGFRFLPLAQAGTAF